VTRAHENDNQAHAAQGDGGKDADDALVQRLLAACDCNIRHALAFSGGGYRLPWTGVAGAGTRFSKRVDVATALLRCTCETVGASPARNAIVG
jgi:hypothetical protein